MDNLTSLIIPHGPHWAIEPQAAAQLLAALRAESVAMHRAALADHVADLRIQAASRSGDRERYESDGKVAIIPIVGTMIKGQSSLGGTCSTVQARKAIRAAVEDKGVSAIMLCIDSPGGTVAGTNDLAQDVASAAKSKPVYAYIEDLGCSAAYWVASQATKVFANSTAIVGSLGTYNVVTDYSRMAENEGIKVHVLSTGKFKGAGVPGSRVEDEQIDAMQSLVDDLNEDFVAAVAKGRNMSVADTRALFDGSVMKAPLALKAGLVDQICSFDKALTSLRQSDALRADDHTTISSEDAAPAAATLAEETETLLADARVLTGKAHALRDRIASLKAARADEGRDLGPKAAGHLADAANALDCAAGGLKELMPAIRPKSGALEVELALAKIALA